MQYCIKTLGNLMKKESIVWWSGGQRPKQPLGTHEPHPHQHQHQHEQGTANLGLG